MRLLLDEMLARDRPRVACGQTGRTDPEVLDLARGERRALVTDNLRDYRPLHHAAIAIGGPGHYGMVFIPGGYSRAKRDTGRIVTAHMALLADHPGTHDLVNAEAWL